MTDKQLPTGIGDAFDVYLRIEGEGAFANPQEDSPSAIGMRHIRERLIHFMNEKTSLPQPHHWQKDFEAIANSPIPNLEPTGDKRDAQQPLERFAALYGYLASSFDTFLEKMDGAQAV